MPAGSSYRLSRRSDDRRTFFPRSKVSNEPRLRKCKTSCVNVTPTFDKNTTCRKAKSSFHVSELIPQKGCILCGWCRKRKVHRP